MSEIDPVTLEVLRNACVAVAEEMNATLVRTSYSPNIKDRRDCSCALFDVVDEDGTAAAEMISQAENIPVHLGAMPYSVAAAIEAYPPSELQDGDAILLNDPFHGGAHLPDMTLVTPIFVDGELVAIAANRAHHADVGGGRAGSVAADSTEIFQEGIRVPPVKLYDGGGPVEDVFDLLLTNVRTPDERRGDFRAQRAANRTAVERVRDLADRHGLGTLQAATTEIKAYAERRMRAEIDELPDGTVEFEDRLDDDGQGTEDIRIAVAVTVDGDELVVDFEGTSEQVPGAINAPLAVTASATYYAVRCVTDPDVPPNAGTYRPIEIRAPEGTVVNAQPPAAVVGGNLEISQRATDALLGAFGEESPERSVAAAQGTMNSVTFGGTNREGEPFAFYETIGGGYGGRTGADGMDGVHAHMSNTLNTPAEVLETVYPVRVQRYAFRPDTGGAGEFRGGLGLRRDIEVLTDGIAFSLLADRRRYPPYGLAGGVAGAVGEDYLTRADDDPRTIPGKSTHDLDAGDMVSIRTPGGGGFGDPADREPEAVARDLRLGKVSTATVRQVYGLDPTELDD
ncbi:hydantoinase B/oxoprolinase family protein [Haloplanus aerogenes]|uniref:Hydantoinase B/oxoprolinase family protein n=1 Tax=Haloplanus aerogenes TaxID=660522 RepID=A0A3M0D2X3_9EURY|nr:hydantoinase B/oxoprolinase family protein [Haloplanus aerogenes]AZH25225.1 hydantoinase B/oxoprolinase family protein [Haloplanus aerogenes]RMB13546.1 N-methylhydantoinase B [Haloplanus aerogenes]